MVVSTVVQTHCGAECAILASIPVGYIDIFDVFIHLRTKLNLFFLEKGFGTEMNNISGIF